MTKKDVLEALDTIAKNYEELAPIIIAIKRYIEVFTRGP